MDYKLIVPIFLFSFSFTHAEGLDKLNPRSPEIENVLKAIDADYEVSTGRSAWLPQQTISTKSCYRANCATWARINLKDQLFHLYIDGTLTYTWKTSTGAAGYQTPLMDIHPSGRIYEAYSSTLYPEGDFEGLGNMPYAVFIVGGYAIHGTPEANWIFLGTTVSGGCIRLTPENAKIFNRLVRANGRLSVWITIESGR